MEIEVVESTQIGAGTRDALRALWDRALGGRFTDADAEHAYGGVHVLARDRDRLIGHASAVPRLIRFGAQLWRLWAHGDQSRFPTAPDRTLEITCQDRPATLGDSVTW